IGIYINPRSKTYKIKVKRNTIVGTGSGIGISIITGKVVTKGNSISSVSKKIKAASAASVTKN
ncbi:MAG: hypothetical protein LUF92_10405, partial [Clostridiales bacterium]|nr:hypothetical protein [Clostridiales bacterium]